MAARPFWQGYLKLSLVTCPVAMTPAVTGAEKVRFHILNEKTGNRVISKYVDKYVDADTVKPVDSDEQVKGYQVADAKHVMIEDEELEAVALESTRAIDTERFVPAESVEPIWLDKAHYLTPADEVGEEAFAVIRAWRAVSPAAWRGRSNAPKPRSDRRRACLPRRPRSCPT